MKAFFAFAYASTLLAASHALSASAAVTTFAYPGWDAPGNDIESFLSGNQGNCAKSCLERSNCSAADFDQDDGRCWLKTRSSQPVRTANSVLILKILSGKDGIDYPGGDYRNYQTSSWQNCSRACFTETQCKAFAYDKNTSTCWLKNGVVDASFEGHSVAGRK